MLLASTPSFCPYLSNVVHVSNLEEPFQTMHPSPGAGFFLLPPTPLLPLALTRRAYAAKQPEGQRQLEPKCLYRNGSKGTRHSHPSWSWLIWFGSHLLGAAARTVLGHLGGQRGVGQGTPREGADGLPLRPSWAGMGHPAVGVGQESWGHTPHQNLYIVESVVVFTFKTQLCACVCTLGT